MRAGQGAELSGAPLVPGKGRAMPPHSVLLGLGHGSLLVVTALSAVVAVLGSRGGALSPGGAAAIVAVLALLWIALIVYAQPDDVLALVAGDKSRVTWRQRRFWWREEGGMKPRIALTIDDVPCDRRRFGVSDFARSLDVLKRHGARATLFVMCDEIAEHPDAPAVEELLRAAVRDHGCELGNHSVVDEKSAFLGRARLREHLERCDAALRALDPAFAQRKLKWFRPGGGMYHAHMLDLAEQMGYRTVLGNVYPHDAHGRDAAHSIWYIKRRAREGGIIIVHDRPGKLADTLEGILPALQATFDVVTLSELFANEA